MPTTANALALAFCLWASGAAAIAAPPAVERDLAYGPAPLQRLDLALPAVTGFPTLVFVHGGSLTDGDKQDDDVRDVCAGFPAQGVGCANVNYRLAPAAAWPAPADDVAAAVAWLHGHIASRGGDPQRLFLLGHSSGAMLVALLGADGRYLERQRVPLAAIRGVMAMGSVMWDDELEQALATHGHERVEQAFRRDPDNGLFASLDAYLDHWPIRHVRAGMPPFLFLIAEAEQEQPPVLRTDSTFVERARALGNQAEVEILRGRTHYSAVRGLGSPGDAVFDRVLAFLRRQGGGPAVPAGGRR